MTVERSIEAVIFDLDDTLISWAKPAVTREQYYRPRLALIRSQLVTKGYRLPPDQEFYRLVDKAMMDTWDQAKNTWMIRSVGDVLIQQLEEMGVDRNQVDADTLLRSFDWGPRPGVELFPDTLPVLEALRRRKYKIGLLTNSFVPMWMRDEELRAYKILDYFDARITAADVGYIKPHPAIYCHLLEMLQAEASRTVFVGDRPKNDIAGANKAGLVSVLIEPSHLERDREGIHPDFTISGLSELLPLLDNLERGN